MPLLSVTLISAFLIFAIPYNGNVPHSVTLIPGDGIGPEVADATVRAVNATGVAIDWERVELNADIILETREVLPPQVIESIARTRVGLKGPVTTPIAGGFPSVNVALRKALDLFASRILQCFGSAEVDGVGFH